MKVLTERDKFLSDYEVVKHLADMKAQYNWGGQDGSRKPRVSGGGAELEIINKQALAFLGTRPCSIIKSDDQFKEFAVYLNQFKLVKVEKLQIINSLPRSMVHLYALIEECDQRFDEDTCTGILEKINELFPVEEDEENGEEQPQE